MPNKINVLTKEVGLRSDKFCTGYYIALLFSECAPHLSTNVLVRKLEYA